MKCLAGKYSDTRNEIRILTFIVSRQHMDGAVIAFLYFFSLCYQHLNQTGFGEWSGNQHYRVQMDMYSRGLAFNVTL